LSKTKTLAFTAACVIVTLTLIFTVTAQQPRTVDANILKNAGTTQDPLPGTWLTYGLTQTEQRYSILKQIDATNVGKLGLAWSAPLVEAGGRGGTEGTALMWNNTIYQPMDNSIVYALDARTGEKKWMYDAKIDPVTRSHMCCGTHNRGLAISDGRIILAANDARLIALDAITGKELWQTKVADINQYYSLTIAPRIAGDKVVIGVAGGEYFIRGFFAAYNIKDGSLAWKFHTVPPKPGEPFEDKAQEDAAKTWTGDWAKYGGGAPVWDGLVYDADENLVIAGTGNAEPWPQELRSIPKDQWGKWDNLYTCSIVAVDAKTGKLKWHYQTVPTDSWDFDGVGGFIMADIQIEGRTRKVIMQAPKSGVFYILDRTNGQFISAEPFVPVNWVTGFDKKNNGRPVINPDAFYDQNKVVEYGQTGRVPLVVVRDKPIQQKVGCTRGTRWQGCGCRGSRDFEHTPTRCEAAGEVARRKGLEVGRPGLFCVDRLEPPCRFQQQSRRVAAPGGEERELCPHRVDPGLLKVVR